MDTRAVRQFFESQAEFLATRSNAPAKITRRPESSLM